MTTRSPSAEGLVRHHGPAVAGDDLGPGPVDADQADQVVGGRARRRPPAPSR
ncbi:MAG: hypothetical protein M0C28_02695 [Candidatus Moduliflexus flocculans]|nr:hypothetical protein [Candidatus Moduliflexus flocculans]